MRGKEWLVERRLVLASGLAASLPIVFSVIQAVSAGWVPLGDDAAIALRAYDVFTDRSSLTGLPSTGPTGVLEEQAYHLGPLLFWLLALPARFMDPSSLVVAVGLVNVAATIGVVALARRRGGLPLMFATAVALPLMLSSLPTHAYSDVWNPAAALMPFTLLIFAAWSLACGEYRLLPVAVLSASFAAQCHLAYLIPSLGALVVGVAGLAIVRLTGRDREQGQPDDLLPWLGAGAAVGLVAWSAPIIDLFTGSPSNLQVLWEAARAGDLTLGPDVGVRALVLATGVPPWWLDDPRVAIERVAELREAPGTLVYVSAALVLAGVAATTVVGVLRRRADVAAAGVLALVLCVAIVQFTSSIPDASIVNLGYGLWWASPVGMFVWLSLGWSIAALLAPLSRVASVASRPSRAGPVAAGLAAALAVGLFVAVDAEWREEPFDAMNEIDEALAEVPERPTRVVASSDDVAFLALDLQTGMVQSLRRRGFDEVTAPGIATSLGADYGAGGVAPRQVVRVDVDSQPPPGGRVVFRERVTQWPELGDPFAPKVPPERTVVVTLRPGPPGS